MTWSPTIEDLRDWMLLGGRLTLEEYHEMNPVLRQAMLVAAKEAHVQRLAWTVEFGASMFPAMDRTDAEIDAALARLVGRMKGAAL